MSAETELVEALKLIRQENARLQAECTRLRDIVATYPERLSTVVTVLAELRTLIYSLVEHRPRAANPLPWDEPPLTSTGLAPEPEERWWPRDSGPDLRRHEGPPAEGLPTQVEIPDEPQWRPDETEAQ